MSSGPETSGGGLGSSNHVRLQELRNRWSDPDDGEVPSRSEIGFDLACHGHRTHSFKHLQCLIAGVGNSLPHAAPNVRIVTSRDGWKEDFALVYGFPSDESGHIMPYATRTPEEAAIFRVFYGSNYGSGGYHRIETIDDVDPDTLEAMSRGEFTDDAAEQLLEEHDKAISIYWELMIAARDAHLNPSFGERVCSDFYRIAG